jgi:DNA-binding NarL/FixJ family response regulator
MDETELLIASLRKAGLPLESCHDLERVEFWRKLTAEEAGRYREILKAHRPHNPLTKRQLQILKMVAQGLQGKEIAQELGISTQTVKNHLTHVFARLGALNNVQAVYIAITRKYILV